MLCGPTRTVSLEELPRAEPGSRISMTNPIYKDFTCAPRLPGSAKAAVAFAHIHATCSAGSEHVELVEGPVVDELQAEKVSLPVEEPSIVLGEANGAEVVPAVPDSGVSGSVMAATAQGRASRSRKLKEKKKSSRKPMWVSVLEAEQPLAPADRMHQFEGASRCTSSASYYTSPEALGWQEAEEIVTPTAPSDRVSVTACPQQPAEVRLSMRLGTTSFSPENLAVSSVLRIIFRCGLPGICLTCQLLGSCRELAVGCTKWNM